MNRITNMSIITRVNGNINRRLADLSKLQTQLATGKKISVASEDPLATNKILAFKAMISDTQQLAKNAEDAVTWIQSTELALAEVSDLLQRVRELAIMGGSAMEPSARQAVGEELGQILEHLTAVANTTFDGDRYLFAGNMITTRPFELLADGSSVYHGDNGQQHYEIVRGTLSPVSITGETAFHQPDLFKIITDLRDTIFNADPISGNLADIDSGIDNILEQRAICGARMNRYQLTVERYADEELNFTSLLSLTQDIDLAESLMRYTLMENTYQAALSMAARTIQPTILDFIR